MTGIVERIGSLAGTELSKALNLAHNTFQSRMGVHNHFGRALIETVAEVARNHPNLVGIGVGLLVEQLLAEEKRRHDHNAEQQGLAPHAAPAPTTPSPSPSLPAHAEHHGFALPHPHLPQGMIKLSTLRPGRIAMEVFGALLLLKLAASGAKMFRHKHQGEVWFAPAARIRLWSGTIAAYYLAKSLRSPKISAWRNAAIMLFGTDAIKPLLRPVKGKRPAATAWTTPAVTPPPPVSAPAAPSAEAATPSWGEQAGSDQTESVPRTGPPPLPAHWQGAQRSIQNPG